MPRASMGGGYRRGVLERSIPIDVRLDLRATLRPVSLVWGSFRPDGWWRPLRTPDGPATVHIRRTRDAVHARAWGGGAGWVLGRLDRLVGLCDDPESFAPDHAVVAELHRRSPGTRFASTGLVFDALLVAIASQKVTGKEAAAALRSMAFAFSDAAPGPVPLRLPPDPARLAAARYHDFHRMRMERRRADLVIRVAGEAERLDRLATRSSDAARARLERIQGIGRWTSAETVAVSHGDADAVSVGDFHLKHYAAWHLAGEQRGTDERMLELLEPFRPHRGRVLRLLESAGSYPRFGPRMAILDHRGH